MAFFASAAARRQRQGHQRESPPLPGQDSVYGVRSIGSVWSAPSSPEASLHLDRPAPAIAPAAGGDGSSTASPTSFDHSSPVLPSSPTLSGSARSDDSEYAAAKRDQTPKAPLATVLSSLSSSPDSPSTLIGSFAPAPLIDNASAEHVAALPTPSPPLLHSLTAAAMRQSLSGGSAEAPDVTDIERDSEHASDHSVPSSPASLASLPSFAPSLSSLSRTSSPALSGNGYPYAFHTPASASAGMADDLVLPTLNLPSTSLHLSLHKWERPVHGALRVVLLASPAKTRELVRALQEREEVVEVAKREVGLVRDGNVVLCLLTGLTNDQTRAKINGVYDKLDGMINPKPRHGQEQLAALVDGYAQRAEWVHMVYCIDGDVRLAYDLSPVVPTMVQGHQHAALFTPPVSATTNFPQDVSESLTRSTALSPPSVDPTPMPSAFPEQSGYFGPRSSSPATSSTSPASHLSRTVEQLLQLIRENAAVQAASTAKFLAWRPTPEALESSMTSTASSGPEMPPMPTVARASGGGEWEATLSRRLAQRKADDIPVFPRGQRGVRGEHVRGRGRRRSSRTKEQPCNPLFPSRSVHSAGLGKGVQESLGGFKGWLRGRGRWVAVVGVVGVVLAVGVGWWTAKRA